MRGIGSTGVRLALAAVAATSCSLTFAMTATAQTPKRCELGDPTYCYFHPRPNIEVFCGRDRGGDYASGYDFRGCRVRLGGAEVKCGKESRHWFRTNYALTGCIVTFGVNRVLVGCESEHYAGSGADYFDETCGAAPVATCTTKDDHIFGAGTSTKTCGREPLVVRCVNAVNPYGPGAANYCELLIGRSASPIFFCRLDRTSEDATVASLLGCVTGLAARRRSG